MLVDTNNTVFFWCQNWRLLIIWAGILSAALVSMADPPHPNNHSLYDPPTAAGLPWLNTNHYSTYSNNFMALLLSLGPHGNSFLP